MFALALLLSGCAAKEIDAFYVTDATFASARTDGSVEEIKAQLEELDKKPEFILQGHRIRTGFGNIIAIREYLDQGMFSTDRSSFNKVTLFVRSIPTIENQKNIYTDSEVLGFLSHGASNFPSSNGCYGYGTGGELSITKMNIDTLSIELNMEFNQVSPKGWNEECSSVLFKLRVISKSKDMEQLTPWDGIKGPNLYDESMK